MNRPRRLGCFPAGPTGRAATGCRPPGGPSGCSLPPTASRVEGRVGVEGEGGPWTTTCVGGADTCKQLPLFLRCGPGGASLGETYRDRYTTLCCGLGPQERREKPIPGPSAPTRVPPTTTRPGRISHTDFGCKETSQTVRSEDLEVYPGFVTERGLVSSSLKWGWRSPRHRPSCPLGGSYSLARCLEMGPAFLCLATWSPALRTVWMKPGHRSGVWEHPPRFTRDLCAQTFARVLTVWFAV